MVNVTTVFERVRKPHRGYSVEQVDAFMERARRQVNDNPVPAEVTSSEVRSVGFDLVRGGYDVDHIDATMSRLETALAYREREMGILTYGAEGWTERVRERARVLLERARRPRRKRFARAGVIRYGYSMREVDALCDQIVAYLTEGEPLTVDELRSAVFRRQRNGYSEWQVDMAIDRMIEVIFAVG